MICFWIYVQNCSADILAMKSNAVYFCAFHIHTFLNGLFGYDFFTVLKMFISYAKFFQRAIAKRFLIVEDKLISVCFFHWYKFNLNLFYHNFSFS